MTVRQLDWTSRAKCKDMRDALFAEGAEQRRVKAVCQNCVVRLECLVEALDNRIEWGVWGGMTERERRTLLRQRGDVESWAKLVFADGTSQDRALSVR